MNVIAFQSVLVVCFTAAAIAVGGDYVKFATVALGVFFFLTLLCGKPE